MTCGVKHIKFWTLKGNSLETRKGVFGKAGTPRCHMYYTYVQLCIVRRNSDTSLPCFWTRRRDLYWNAKRRHLQMERNAVISGSARSPHGITYYSTDILFSRRFQGFFSRVQSLPCVIVLRALLPALAMALSDCGILILNPLQNWTLLRRRTDTRACLFAACRGLVNRYSLEPKTARYLKFQSGNETSPNCLFR